MHILSFLVFLVLVCDVTPSRRDRVLWIMMRKEIHVKDVLVWEAWGPTSTRPDGTGRFVFDSTRFSISV